MRLKSWRRLAQISTLLLLLAIPLANQHGLHTVTGNLYALAVGNVWMTDPLCGLQVMLLTLTGDRVLLLSLAIPVILALLFGKVFCSWICPQNALCEASDYLARRLYQLSCRQPTSYHVTLPDHRLWQPKPTARSRYILLVLVLALVPWAGIPLANYLSAPGIISVEMARLVYDWSLDVEFLLIPAILVAEMFLLRRLWCNYVCPVGTVLGCLQMSRSLRVAYAKEQGSGCAQCLRCIHACQLNLNPLAGHIYPLCHNCGDCVVACHACHATTQEKHPLTFRFGRK